MDEATLKAWGRLRSRVNYGETLTPEEQARYESGLAELNAAEKINSEYIGQIRDAVERIAEYEQERARLREERIVLESRLAALEPTTSKAAPTASGVREG